MDRLILLIFLFLCPPLVRSQAQQGSRSYKDKLVFGRAVRRGSSSARQRNSVEFAGGETRRGEVEVEVEGEGKREDKCQFGEPIYLIIQISFKIFKLKEKYELEGGDKNRSQTFCIRFKV